MLSAGLQPCGNQNGLRFAHGPIQFRIDDDMIELAPVRDLVQRGPHALVYF